MSHSPFRRSSSGRSRSSSSSSIRFSSRAILCAAVHSLLTPAADSNAAAVKLVYRMTPNVCREGFVVAAITNSTLSHNTLDHSSSQLVALLKGVHSTDTDNLRSSSSSSSNQERLDHTKLPLSVGCASSLGIFPALDRISNQPSSIAALVSPGTFQDVVRSHQTTSNNNDKKTEDGLSMGLSWELWIKPQRTSVATRSTQLVVPVLTIGTKYPNLKPTVGGVRGDTGTTNATNATNTEYAMNTSASGIPDQSAASTTFHSECDEDQKDFQLTIIDSTWTVIYRIPPKNDTDNNSASINTTTTWDNCRVHTFGPPVSWSQLTHLVLVFQNQKQVAYVNGQAFPIARDTLIPFQDWKVQSMGLYVLGYHATSTVDLLPPRDSVAVLESARMSTTTILYQLSLSTADKTTVLPQSAADVHKLLHQGLPPTRPFAYDQVLLVNEDAERIPGSHSLDWYRLPSVLTNDTARLLGPLVASLDREVQDSISTFPLRSNSATAKQLEKDVQHETVFHTHVYLTSLPSVGRLYLNGTPLLQYAKSTTAAASSMLIPLGVDPVTDLVYLPPHNAYSKRNEYSRNVVEDSNAVVPMASFHYCVSDSAIFHASQCQSTATISIHVNEVNDPPVARPVPLTVVREGLDSQPQRINRFGVNDHRYGFLDPSPKIPLLGSDVDTNDHIQAVEITQAPLHGDLILAVSSFRHDFIPHGTPLSKLNFTVQTSSSSGSHGDFDDLVYVRYIWRRPFVGHLGRRLNAVDGADNASSSGLYFSSGGIHGTNRMDYFTFRVQDRYGVWSIDERVELMIVSAVSGHVDETMLVVQEDSVSTIRWWGDDASGYHRELRFFVELIPPSYIGVLWDTATNTVLHAESTMKTSSEFPYQTGVSIQFQSSRNYCHDSSSTLEYDAEIRFRVVALDNGTVTSVSDAITQNILVSCSPDVISMTVPWESVTVMETNLNRVIRPRDDSEGDHNEHHVAVLSGIEVSSVDRSQHGTDKAWISVTTHAGYLTFDANYWNRTEPVRGRGTSAGGTVVFFAHPDDLTDILTDLRYHSYHVGNDTIELQVRYGNCLPSAVVAASRGETGGSCQVLNRTIAVTILRDPEKYKAHTRMVVGFPWQILFCLLCYPLLYAAVVYLEGTFAGDHSDSETVLEGSPLEPDERYVQHEDEHGMFYYEDRQDGTVQWDLPSGEDFVHFEEIGQ